MNANEIKQRLNDLDNQIDRLTDERCKLQQELFDSERADNRKRYDAWGIKEGSCILCFAKQLSGYHWDMAKTIKVIDVDEVHQFIDTVTGTYRESDYEYYFKCETERIPFTSLEKLEAEFNLYFVDSVQLSLLQQHMAELKITYDNLRKYEETFSKDVTAVIRI